MLKKIHVTLVMELNEKKELKKLIVLLVMEKDINKLILVNTKEDINNVITVEDLEKSLKNHVIHVMERVILIKYTKQLLKYLLELIEIKL